MRFFANSQKQETPCTSVLPRVESLGACLHLVACPSVILRNTPWAFLLDDCVPRPHLGRQAVQKFRMFVTCFPGLEEGQRPLFSASSHRVLLPDTGGPGSIFGGGMREHDSTALSFCLSGLLVFVVLSCFFERGSRDPQGPGSLIAKGREAFSGGPFS